MVVTKKTVTRMWWVLL